ncbi:HutD family protein [Devosia sp.]|uniref:HutD/Ves family protein n=1 Tax=Devosia sp. TaxID=1871048 RepID=UPI002EFB1DAB
MRLLPAHTHRAMPWKNGGGETLEIAVHPQGAPVDGCTWRVSMAKVPVSGAFSTFPLIHRTLAVLAGRMLLRVEGQPETLLTPASPPCCFPGDVPAAAEVLAPVIDLNVMVRRGAAVTRVRRLGPCPRVAATAETLVVLGDEATLAGGRVLAARDVVWLAAGETAAFERPFQRAWMVEILPA